MCKTKKIRHSISVLIRLFDLFKLAADKTESKSGWDGEMRLSGSIFLTRFLSVRMREPLSNVREMFWEALKLHSPGWAVHCSSLVVELHSESGFCVTTIHHAVTHSKMWARHLDVTSPPSELWPGNKGLHKPFWVTLSEFKTWVMQRAFDGRHKWPTAWGSSSRDPRTPAPQIYW